MTDKKLTDEQIAQAVKSHEEKLLTNGLKCIEPFEVREIVKRQQEEIERLKEGFEKLNEKKKLYTENMQAIREYQIKQAKSEAIKEFTERLKGNFTEQFCGQKHDLIHGWIDNLVKEMVGENGGLDRS